jgi:metal-responsive CopG/Arc/MetJ family transcriptional regulator
MKAAISLPDDLFEAAEIMVESRGWTRSRLYAEALREYLRHQDPSDITERLNRVHSTPNDPDARALRRRANRQALGASDW